MKDLKNELFGNCLLDNPHADLPEVEGMTQFNKICSKLRRPMLEQIIKCKLNFELGNVDKYYLKQKLRPPSSNI